MRRVTSERESVLKVKGNIFSESYNLLTAKSIARDIIMFTGS